MLILANPLSAINFVLQFERTLVDFEGYDKSKKLFMKSKYP